MGHCLEGFSGVDGRTLDPDSRVFPNGVFCSHAVDKLVARLHDPFSAAPKDSYAPPILVGGASQKTTEISERLARVITNRKMTKVTTIPEIIDLDLQPKKIIFGACRARQTNFCRPR